MERRTDAEASEEPEEDIILDPGDHILKLALYGKSSRETLEAAFLKMGVSRVVIDETKRVLEPMTPVLVIVSTEQPIVLRDTDVVHWMMVEELGIRPFDELHYKLVPFELRPDRLYETLFVARMKAHPTADHVVKVLGDMRGFEVLEILALKRDMRVPGHPGTSATLWMAVARWNGPPSHVNMDDPVCFEQVVEVDENDGDEDDEEEEEA